jgi:hypothetical protein
MLIKFHYLGAWGIRPSAGQEFVQYGGSEVEGNEVQAIPHVHLRSHESHVSPRTRVLAAARDILGQTGAIGPAFRSKGKHTL